jgi:hypothetical protein
MTFSLLNRFLSKIKHPKNRDCWIWTGAIDPEGYARINVCGINRQAHRISYELHRGKIPLGLEIDHLCRVRNCVNPNHLEPVTRRINTLRGDRYAMGWKRFRKICAKGHLYSKFGFYSHKKILSDGSLSAFRQCKQCTKKWKKSSRKEGVA